MVRLLYLMFVRLAGWLVLLETLIWQAFAVYRPYRR
jgi:hypothetical protein